MNKITNLAVKISKKIIKYDDLLEENRLLKEQINSSGLEIKALSKSIVALNEDSDLPKKENIFGWPSGHYYSPVHKPEDLKDYEEVLKRSRDKFTKSIPGFSEKRMLDEFNIIKKYFSEFDFPKTDDGKGRFYTQNVSISMMDALALFSMIKSKKPKKIIEIGSGFTSALMMEVNEKFFDNKIDITFIEPFPEILKQRMSNKDKSKYRIIEKGVQFVPVDIFKTLEEGDILFIDSTHVSKFNSDVNYELFDVLPELKSGVIIHFHDILDGFEYPIYWLEKGWAWNEAYLLRAFLMGNKDYEVLLMTNYLTYRYPELLKKSYSKEDILNGGDLWIRKR